MKTALKKKIDIAKENHSNPGTVTRLINGERKTYNVMLAMAVSEMTGRKPSDFLSDKIKSLAIEIHPDLDRKPKKRKAS